MYEFIPPSAGGIGWLRPLLFSKEKMPLFSQAGVPPLQNCSMDGEGFRTGSPFSMPGTGNPFPCAYEMSVAKVVELPLHGAGRASV